MMIQRSITLLFLLMSISFAKSIPLHNELVGKWYCAEGSIKDTFQTRYIEFTNDGRFILPTRPDKKLTYSFANDSIVVTFWDDGDTLDTYIFRDKKYLLELNYRDTTYFLKEHQVYPAKGIKTPKAMVGSWQLLKAFSNESDTIHITADSMYSAKKRASGDSTSGVAYRLIDEKLIECVYNGHVDIAPYRLEGRLLIMETPLTYDYDGFAKLPIKFPKVSKKIRKSILGEWAGDRFQKAVFTEEGYVISDNDSIPFRIISDKLLHFGDSLSPNYQWYSHNGAILTIIENCFNETGDTTYMLNTQQTLTTEELEKILPGEWFVAKAPRMGSSDSVNFLFTADSQFVYVKGQRMNSVACHVRDGALRLPLKHRPDTVAYWAAWKGDTLCLTSQIQLVRCTESFTKLPHEKIYKQSFPALTMHQVYDSLTSFLELFPKKERLQELCQSHAYGIGIAPSDTAEFTALLNKSDEYVGSSLRILYTAAIKYSQDSVLCDLILIDKSPQLSGDMIYKVTLDATTRAWSRDLHVVQFSLNETGTAKFKKVTEKLQGHRLAMLINGSFHSAPTIKEPVTAGVFTMTIKSSKEDSWETAFERLLEWGK